MQGHVTVQRTINHLSHAEQVVSMQEAIADWSARCHVHIRDR